MNGLREADVTNSRLSMARRSRKDAPKPGVVFFNSCIIDPQFSKALAKRTFALPVPLTIDFAPFTGLRPIVKLVNEEAAIVMHFEHEAHPGRYVTNCDGSRSQLFDELALTFGALALVLRSCGLHVTPEIAHVAH